MEICGRDQLDIFFFSHDLNMLKNMLVLENKMAVVQIVWY